MQEQKIKVWIVVWKKATDGVKENGIDPDWILLKLTEIWEKFAFL